VYFYLSQTQYLLLGLLGGVLFLLVLILGYFASRFGTKRIDPDEPAEVTHEFSDGLLEGNRPVPIILILLAVIIVLWMAGYVIAISQEWLHVQ